MVAFPHCKINLGLHVVAKRPDGYHNIETCFYPVPWHDVLEIVRADAFSFTQTGDAIPGDTGTNLCVKAWQLLQQDHHLPPVAMHLHKILPLGAGLGGGSSDGAHVLVLLNRLFNLSLSDAALASYAARLGSDCAFFVTREPMLGTGRGEILEPVSVPLQGKFLVLIKPPVHVSTAEAYAGVRPAQPALSLRDIIEHRPVTTWRELLVNDFESSVFARYPEIQKIKEDLYAHGAVYAAMSGSGASVFGIFDTPVTIPVPASYRYWSGMLPAD